MTDFLDGPVKPIDTVILRSMVDGAVHEAIDQQPGPYYLPGRITTGVLAQVRPLLQDRDAHIVDIQDRINEMQDRLDRARRHASFLRGELYRERTRRETAQDYRRTAVWSAIADVLAVKAPDLDIAEEWTDEAMNAISRALPDAEENDR